MSPFSLVEQGKAQLFTEQLFTAISYSNVTEHQVYDIITRILYIFNRVNFVKIMPG